MRIIVVISFFYWFTPLTAQINYLIKDIELGTDSSSPYDMKEYGGELYFLVTTGNTQSLYKTDGTASGTVEVIAGMQYVYEYHLASNNKIFLSAAMPADSEEELYVHSGIVGASPTKLTINLSGAGKPNYFKEANGRLYFFARINSTSNTWQVASVDINTNAVFNHIAPSPYDNFIIVNNSKNEIINGYGAFVTINNFIFYSVSGPSGNALFKLDTSSPTSSPVLIAAGVSNDNYNGLYPFNGKVYFSHSGQLKYSDGNTVNTISSNLNPYYFQTFNNKLYFAGVASTNSSHSVLYEIDVSNNLVEFGNIRAEGAIGNSQAAKNYSILVLNNKLHVFINEFPTTSFYNLCEIDFSNPSLPSYTIVLDEHPAAMYELELVGGHFYYGKLNTASNKYEFKKKNLTFNTTICEHATDMSNFEITHFGNEIIYIYSGPESINCDLYGNVGLELHKLTPSQISCVTNATIPGTSLIGYEGVFAGNQTVDITGNVLLNQDRCIMFSTLQVIVSGSFQVASPTKVGLILQGCP